MDPEDKDYVCTLDEASLAIAKDELNELPTDRLSSVSAFRKWISQQKTWKCRTDTQFLLLFLRVAKFSQIAARERLQGYLTMKTKHPVLYNDIDARDPKLLLLFKTGFALPLGFDPKGRFTILFRQGSIATDNKKYKLTDVWHAMFVMCHWALCDEKIMVNGINWMTDLSGFDMAHFMFWGVEGIQKWMHIFQKNFPARFKTFHCYNAGIVFDKVLAVAMPLMSKKMKERLFVHGSNLENVYKVFPKSMLPKEYLPDDYEGPCAGTIDEISNKLVADLTADKMRNKMLHWSSKEWTIDRKEKADTAQPSFRKIVQE